MQFFKCGSKGDIRYLIHCQAKQWPGGAKVAVLPDTDCQEHISHKYNGGLRAHDIVGQGAAFLRQSQDGLTDTLLGGSKNYVELYCNDAAITCNLTLNNLMSTYLLDEDGLDNVVMSEMLPSKTGWNNPFISDEVIHGYHNEIQDFMECIAENRQPESIFGLARETTLVMYAAYLSSELGEKVIL